MWKSRALHLPYILLIILICTGTISAAEHGPFGQKVRDAQRLSGRAVPQQAPLKLPQDDFRFLNQETQPYLVESLPDVPFDIGEIYSGSVPIDQGNDSRSLFFVFQPTIGDPVDEITIWLNGGPGCSSLQGFFQENGRFLWQKGTYLPVQNPYSWVNLTNMLWVDQPVGAGFALGTPTATSQEDIADDFVKFFKNFQQIFGIKRFRIFVTGESYAGRYVPYISAAMLDQNDTEYYDMQGALVYDPCIGQYDYVQEQAPAVPFVQENANLFNFNASFMEEIESLHKTCGYESYMDEYLTFPPSSPQPPVSFNVTDEATSCNIFGSINAAVLQTNPCFNIYQISQMCPLQWDVLAFPTAFLYQPAGATVYFDRADVKRALHAPEHITWAACTEDPVFVGGPEAEGDLSANPIETVLPQVIEATNRVLVSNGDYDMIILTNGTLLAIQNMTWNGALGFQAAPSTPINITLPDLQYRDVFMANNATGWQDGQGVMGVQHYERGLMWAQSFQTGHMQPSNQPRLTYRHLEWLLGRVDEL
ncbi:putative pheromone processing carboxypeptidase [Aspergillus campestris IBT 28561]|uniref:Carboxypeptidase n=1 Tax=Aspergillus campestris (strain IBT 28561) TaxID=1392248 RepID=A0A2I1D9C8_ASPC2|nr:putative pheromone processing carboxypeptidase [Aspergillus campestris IBT 28561]PKY06468.1 putative pheromone processing carboxypeptidase [Aspergillus campestris IBT 28561]